MDTELQLQAFTDLLALAQATGVGDKTQEKQTELVAACRAAGQPFMASVLVRHRFICPVCGAAIGEAMLHFEDPLQALTAPAAQGMWSNPAGRFANIRRSELHAMRAHGQAMPAGLQELLSGYMGRIRSGAGT